MPLRYVNPSCMRFFFAFKLAADVLHPFIYRELGMKQISRNKLGLNAKAHELAIEEAAKEKAKKEKEDKEQSRSLNKTWPSRTSLLQARSNDGRVPRRPRVLRGALRLRACPRWLLT